MSEKAWRKSWPQHTALGQVWTFYESARRIVKIGAAGNPQTLTAAEARAAAEVLIRAADELDEYEAKNITPVVTELAHILRAVMPGMALPTDGGDYGLAVCMDYARAVYDAGWRKP